MLSAGLIIFSKGPKTEDICDLTNTQPEGPFYKVPNNKRNIDMTNGGKAIGQVIEIYGKVMNNKCKPYQNVIIDVWQANHFGKYNHHNDRSKSKLDLNFYGYLRTITNNEGEYKFFTIYPGSYKLSKNMERTPHLHLKVILENKEFITQLYFKGNKKNKNDFLYKNTSVINNLEVLLENKSDTNIKTGMFNIIV